MNAKSEASHKNVVGAVNNNGLLETLLLARDISTKEDRKRFMHPDFTRDTHNPFLLSGMDVAVDRIILAVKSGERIAVYSDYDMDGIPGAVVLNDFFTQIKYKNVRNYVPDRNIEGFGINKNAIDELADDGVILIITVDCGSRAVKEVAYASELGVETIVTDHHVPGVEIPDAVAFINPNQKGDVYPNKYLCGAGVAYKLVEALVKKIPDIPAGTERWSLDMVAAATIADMVPLLGENRVLTHFGLQVLRKSPRPGIRALCNIVRTKQQYLTEDDIMFSIAPRINAASRMGHAGEALTLLTSSNMEIARTQASHLEKLNKERKAAVITMVKHIKKSVTASEIESRVLLVGDPRWQPGLLGLAATRAVELYNKPVCVWGRGNSSDVKGSCRGDGTINIVSLLESAEEVLVDYGGHEHSGGFSVLTENVHKLTSLLAEYTSEENDIAKHTSVDTTLALLDVNWDTYHSIEQLSPFGMGNPKPVFEFKDISVGTVRWFGVGKAHLELIFHRPDGESVKAIQFFANKNLSEICVPNTFITLLAHIEQSFFGGTPELRLRIVSARV